MHLERRTVLDAPGGLILCPECDSELFELRDDGEVVCSHCGTAYSLRHGADEVSSDAEIREEGC